MKTFQLYYSNKILKNNLKWDKIKFNIFKYLKIIQHSHMYKEWWKRSKPMIEKAQTQIQVQASAQAQQIEDMGQLSIIGCLSFVITFEYF